MLLWKISGEIYLKYVAFYLSLRQLLRLRTNTRRFLFLPVQYYCSSSTAGAQSTTTQATGKSQSENTHTHIHAHTHATCSCVSHLMKTICIWATVDLCCLFTTVNCWAFYTTYCNYFSNRSILQNLWSMTGDWFFSQRVHEKRCSSYLISCCMSSSQIGTT